MTDENPDEGPGRQDIEEDEEELEEQEEDAEGNEQSEESQEPDQNGEGPKQPAMPDPDSHDKIIPRPIEREMKESYIDYSMSVIVGRALPDVRDGLKPVHRRILYAMNEMGLTANRSYKKSARVVGEVLGKFHPHGDTAVYDTMVRMAQNFSLRYPLVDGQGNFGSVDGDRAAAMRYTESRLSRIAGLMLGDLDKETIEFTDNFDASLKEPTILPGMLPNLLVNGSSGIAVGMATNMPPHNLTEVVDGVIATIENPEMGVMDLMDIIQGPDFPTGGTIYGMAGVVEAYNTGRGIIKVRGKLDIETKKNKSRIIITEIPYQVNKSSLVEQIANLAKDKKIDGITDIRDESDRKGMRVVIELRRDVMEDLVVNQLYAHTQLQSSFGINNLALVDNKPKVLGLKEIIEHFVKHRKEIVTRRTSYDLKKAKHRAHILAGLIIALDNIDDIITLIRKSKNVGEAEEGIRTKYELSKEQTKAILDMRLQKLTSLERQAVKDEEAELLKKIAELEKILASEELVLDIIKAELLEIKEKYGDARRTDIEANVEDFEIEDLIPEEDMVVTITNTGYIKRLPVEVYQAQHRGGVGLKGMDTKEEDFVIDLFVTSTHDYILFFSNMGRVYWLKTYRLPVGGRHAKGKAIINLLPRLEKDELIKAALPVHEFTDDQFLIFSTKNGFIKRTKLTAYSRPRVTGIIATKMREDDELISVRRCCGSEEVILGTNSGKAVRFNVEEARAMGRNTQGVIGARLRAKDKVVSMTIARPNTQLLTITENGYGKRTDVDLYRKTHRGGMGVITIKTNERNGAVVDVVEVEGEEELLLTSLNGIIIRIPVNGISHQSRNTMGVRLMRMRPGDKVMSVAKIINIMDETELVDEEESEP
jgi:DNA gyrase subunit A